MLQFKINDLSYTLMFLNNGFKCIKYNMCIMVSKYLSFIKIEIPITVFLGNSYQYSDTNIRT